MNSETILAKLRTEGVGLAAASGRLLLDAPEGVLTDELLAEIRNHKQEILAALQTRQSVAEALPGGVTEAKRSLLAAEVLTMWLPDFARARRVVEVRSDLLDEVVVLASDNAVLDPGDRRAVYRATELQAMVGLTPKAFKTMHAAKRAMDLHLLPS